MHLNATYVGKRVEKGVSMKAAGLYGIGDIRVVELEKPKPGPGEIVVEVKAATTCGTDLKTFLRGRPNQIFPTVPWGHECAGVVAELGRGVKRFKVGDRVAFHNSAPCYHCFFCKKQRYELCENLVVNWGAYAEYIRVPAQIVKINTFLIPDNVSFEVASLLEPFACTVHGAARARINPGDTVCIIGAGFQGFGMAQLARLYGASEIFVVDLVKSRLKLVEDVTGAKTIDASEEDVYATIRDLTDARGCDVVIEAAGTPQTWGLAISLARKGGRVVLYGGCRGGTTITVPTERLHYDALNIEGVFHTTPRYVQIAWDLIRKGKVKLSPTITSRRPLEDVREAYLSLRDNKDEIKVALIP